MGFVKGLIKIVLIPSVALVVIAPIVVALIYFSRAKSEKDLEAGGNHFQLPPIQTRALMQMPLAFQNSSQLSIPI